MKTSHKSDELNNLKKGGPQIGYLWHRQGKLKYNVYICNNTEIQRLRSKYIPKYYVQNSSLAKMYLLFV